MRVTNSLLHQWGLKAYNKSPIDIDAKCTEVQSRYLDTHSSFANELNFYNLSNFMEFSAWGKKGVH